MNYRVCAIEDVPPGEKRAYTVKNIPILLVHKQESEFYAIYRICPHQHADFIYSELGGITEASQPGEEIQYKRQGEILRCAWHGFSFDVTTGACLTEPEKLRVRTYPVTVRGNDVFLDI
jgi:nitrite reductase/ring-hydroxylating ferredoxin subunit